MVKNADYWIRNLQLQPHPEGGFYKEIYASGEEILVDGLPTGMKGTRRLATSIYFLLRDKDISTFHQLKSDEIWYFHHGMPLDVYMIDPGGHAEVKTLGVEDGQQLQIVIPAGTIFGARVKGSEGYSLVGCMVTPGFDFDDFKMFSKEELVQMFPGMEQFISRLTG